MISIFLNKTDAQKYSDKVHNWLKANCPGYNAVKWQEPQKHPTFEQYYIKIPQEYEKPLYKDSIKIILSCSVELLKATEQVEILPIDWRPDEKDIDDIIVKPIIK